MLKLRVLTILFVCVVSVVWVVETGLAASPSRKDLVKKMRDAQRYFKDTVTDPQTAIPKVILQKASGIVILKQFKVGIIFGVKGGGGFTMARNDASQKWSPPAFVTTSEGSVGLQIGGQTMNSIYVVMSKESMKKLLKGGVKIGVNLSAQAGPVGKDIDVNFQKAPEVFIYSEYKGLYTGASFTAASFDVDKEANEIFYGKNVDENAILYNKAVPMPGEATTFAEFLEKY